MASTQNVTWGSPDPITPCVGEMVTTTGRLKDTFKGRALLAFPNGSDSWVPMESLSVVEDPHEPKKLDSVVEVVTSDGERQYFRRAYLPVEGSTRHKNWVRPGYSGTYSWGEIIGRGQWCELKRDTTPHANETWKM